MESAGALRLRESATRVSEHPHRWNLIVGHFGSFFLSWCKPVAILFLIYLFTFTPVLFADVSYVDDIARVASGYPGWEASSRYLSNALAPLLHGSKYLGDVSPLTQIIAIAEMAIAATVILFVATGKKSFNAWEYIAMIPLALSPYFLQCLSYKYDAPYMALSVLVSVAPFVIRDKSKWGYSLATFGCALAMCMTYQASSGIVPMMTIYLVMLRCLEAPKLSKTLIKRQAIFALITLISYAAALLVYRLFLMSEVPPYASADLEASRALVQVVLDNFAVYAQNVVSDFHKVTLFVCLIMFVGFVLSASVGPKYQGARLRNFSIALVSGLLMLVVSLGVYPLLSAPLFEPRGMYGLGIFLSLIALKSCSAEGMRLFKLAALYIGCIIIIFSFKYGNALSVQNEWTLFRADAVAEDLADLEIVQAGNKLTMQIKGTTGYSPALSGEMSQSGILRRLVKITFYGDGWTGAQRIKRYYGLPIALNPAVVEEDWSDLPILSQNYYHIIRGEGDKIRLELL